MTVRGKYQSNCIIVRGSFNNTEGYVELQLSGDLSINLHFYEQQADVEM